MRTTGKYCRHYEYDLDHEINMECENLNDIVKSLNDNNSKKNKRVILKAMIETLINNL